MNNSIRTIKTITEMLSNGKLGEKEKYVAVTIAYSALYDIYGKDTANAVLWAVCETVHVTGTIIPPHCLTELKS